MTVPYSGVLFGLIAVLPIVAQGAAAQPEGQPTALNNPLAAHSLERLTETRDRPLFTPGRRGPAALEGPPPPPVVAQRPDEPAPPPNLVLAGVVVDQNGARAVVRDQGADRIVNLRTGDALGEWRVQQIEPRRLVLVLEDRTAEFSLFRGEAEGAPPSPKRSNTVRAQRRNDPDDD